MKEPNFFIVGAPKCGTTSMAEYLKDHPDVFISVPKEPHYFSTDIMPRTKSADRYFELFRNAQHEQRIGEASVWYLYSNAAPLNIYSFNQQAKIIIMLRNPVDLLYSLYRQFLYSGNENIPNFFKALSAEPRRSRGLDIPAFANFPPGLFYSQVVKFSEQVKRYHHIFGFDNVLVILFDDFVRDTASEYRRTLEFLGVDPEFQVDYKVHNPNKVPRSNIWVVFMQFLDLLSTTAYQRILTRPLRLGMLRKLRLLNTKYAPPTPLDPELRRILLDRFASEILLTSRVIKRDLSLWLQKE